MSKNLSRAKDIVLVVLRLVAIIFEMLAIAIILYTYPRLKLLIWSASLRMKILSLPPNLKNLVIHRYSQAKRRALRELGITKFFRQLLGRVA